MMMVMHLLKYVKYIDTPPPCTTSIQFPSIRADLKVLCVEHNKHN